jgi:hypothetical protein
VVEEIVAARVIVGGVGRRVGGTAGLAIAGTGNGVGATGDVGDVGEMATGVMGATGGGGARTGPGCG